MCSFLFWSSRHFQSRDPSKRLNWWLVWYDSRCRWPDRYSKMMPTCYWHLTLTFTSCFLKIKQWENILCSRNDLQLKTCITSKIFELESRNCAQMKALESTFPTISISVILFEDLTSKSKEKQKTHNNYNWLKFGNKDQLQANVSPKIFELERRNGTQRIALENIFQTVPNFFIFEQLLTELYKKKRITCWFAWHGTTTIKGVPKKSFF